MDESVPARRALVVDDYDHMRQQLANVLKALGLEIVEAHHGADALDKLQEVSVDVVFTDIVMPEMDGYELCQEIRRTPELARLPIVVVSTHYDTHYIIRALQLGADDYVPKPVNKDLVAQVLERIRQPVAAGMEGS
jgi:PleD family two-component response regulator